jgi:hypothetical protein
VVIEDSANGLQAALAAGLATVVTVSSYTRQEDFDGAVLVVSTLGDPGGPTVEVLSDPTDIRPDRYLRLTDLERILSAAPGASGSTAPGSTASDRESERP